MRLDPAERARRHKFAKRLTVVILTLIVFANVGVLLGAAAWQHNVRWGIVGAIAFDLAMFAVSILFKAIVGTRNEFQANRRRIWP
ncbi:MAG: hypothetical protein ABSA31_00050 [Acidimicrobiales bacterium]|jgi:hypothetical protein